jgi:triosephosphate isomerase
MIFINLKTYPKGTGLEALEFVKNAQTLYEEIGAKITILAQAADIRALTENTTLPVWAQHVDNIEHGKNTGWILPDAIIGAGATGSMINHAEHKLPLVDVSDIISKYQSGNFQILVSTTSPEETILIDQLQPAYLAYEPQEYIGTKTSVVDIASDIIRNLVARVKSPLVIGAGIHKPEHITEGLELGAQGFLISSDVLLSPDPVQRLREYMLAYKNADHSNS